MGDTPYTLSALNFAVRNAVQSALPGTQQLVAEISELRESRGHAYLELIEKDKSGRVLAKARATIWGAVFRILTPYFRSETGQDLAAGLKVLITVSVEFHEIYGFSLNIRDIDPAYTLGDIEKRRREIIQQLEEDGILGMNAELEFPTLPQNIAVISSATAAGYGDFINQLQENPAGYQFNITLFEATMQGENTEASVILAFDKIFNNLTDFDLVVLIRGGGSRADLSAFDSYFIAANICQFPLPVLTGIGHERDEAIADLAAHKALKTPTAVAEFLIRKFSDLEGQILDMQGYLGGKVQAILNAEQQELSHFAAYFKPRVKAIIFENHQLINNTILKIKPANEQLISNSQQKLIWLAEKLKIATQNKVKLKQQNLYLLSEQLKRINQSGFKQLHTNREKLLKNIEYASGKLVLNSKHHIEILHQQAKYLDPKRILEKGYTITYSNGTHLKSAKCIKKGDVLDTHFLGGKIKSEVM